MPASDWLEVPEDLHDPALAAEFKASPLGPHGPRLRRLLIVMRQRPTPGKPVFLRLGRRLVLASLPARRGEPLTLHWEQSFAERDAAAEWAAFRLRWQSLFGESLPA